MFLSEDQKDYARNKADPEALVYRDRNSQTYRLTEFQFKNQEEFEKWKSISDESYHRISNGDSRYYKHKVCIGIEELENEPMASEQDSEYRQFILRCYHSVVRKLCKGLTQKQFRRLKLYTEYQMTEKEIAELENIGQSSVSASLSKAERRIKKIFHRNL